MVDAIWPTYTNFVFFFNFKDRLFGNCISRQILCTPRINKSPMDVISGNNHFIDLCNGRSNMAHFHGFYQFSDF